ncbi:uncharacterized protein LOC127102158 [Lathyrus oleraceus]|uniref:uncharacterized protein LOC127102158 n=1 Tax=Pisum sativum TaxID=3888 RepID=UPI0021CE982B|nr:uncharacterized protein LOC127102158 [Pisum sativum]
MYPSPEVEHHSEKDDDSSRSEKDMAAEGLCSLGQIVSSKGKFVASTTANASHSKKHNVANNVIDLEDDRFGDQEESLLHHLKPSVAKRMKTRKGRSVAEMRSAKTSKKTAGVGPSKSWSKTVEWLSPCYEGLVKEFIVNIPEDVADKNSKEFCKVFVRGNCITFSHTVINNFLGRRVKGACELEATDNQVCREITARQVKGWPIKKHLPAGKLTVKYAILHEIGSANWHASTNAVKLPIAFPSMIYGIILSQDPGILSSNDLPSRRKPALSVHYNMFEGSHVEDIVMTSAMKNPASKVGTIAELKETCKELGEGIREAEAHTSNERSATNDETSGNYVFDADEAASSSSSN